MNLRRCYIDLIINVSFNGPITKVEHFCFEDRQAKYVTSLDGDANYGENSWTWPYSWVTPLNS